MRNSSRSNSLMVSESSRPSMVASRRSGQSMSSPAASDWLSACGCSRPARRSSALVRLTISIMPKGLER